jgi:CelD/BcsL family acetyltransferase involved in cellulose biosynthesis
VQHNPVERSVSRNPSDRHGHAGQHSEHVVCVELTTPRRFATMEREWLDLAGRALVDNAFLEPSLIVAAATAAPTTIHVLLAWSAPAPHIRSRLIGLWAVAERPPALRAIRILSTPVHDHAFLGTPVLDRDAAAAALSSMLEAIAGDPSLPHIVRIGSLDATGPVAAIFAALLAQRGFPSAQIETRLRPALFKPLSGCGASQLSASRAKALRKRHRRLGLLGVVAITRHDSADDMAAAVEEFIALEGSGWKAHRSSHGQAILRSPSVTTFFRTAVTMLAAHHRSRITALRLDGRAIAMQLTVYSGQTAFTWKTAYDESLRALSPGLLLHQQITAMLLADPEVSAADSCCHDDTGYMAEFWDGRRAVSDLLIDVRPRRTRMFALVAGIEIVRLRLRRTVRKARAMLTRR